MKKFSAVFLIMIFCVCIPSIPVFAENSQWLISKTQEDEGNDGSFEKVTNYTYVYNNNDYLTQKTSILVNNVNEAASVTVNTTYTYDTNGNKITEKETFDYGNDEAVEWSDFYTYTYDGNRNLITKKHEFDNVDNGTIERVYQHYYTYAADGRMKGHREERDNNNDGSIDAVYRFSFTYDANGNKTFERRTWDDDNDGSVDRVATDTYTYEANGDLKSERNEYDDDNNGILEWSSNTTYSYTTYINLSGEDLGKDINKTTERFDSSGALDSVHRYTDSYDIDGNLVFEKRESDYENNGTFIVVYEITNRYTSNGQRIFSGDDDDDDGSFERIEYWTWQQANANDVDNDGDKFKENQGDCDDTDSTIFPGAVEICGDGIDQDCNGSDLSCADVDNDGDGYTENQGDCDDDDAAINPDTGYTCGDWIDEDPTDVDDDGDGYTENQGDCDDTDSAVSPDAIETCGDGIDQDCSGSDLACVSSPSPPTGVDASNDTFLNKVQVTWNPAAGITTYDIFRADMPAWTGTTPKRIASSVTGTSYNDITAAENRRYYYWVKSRDGSSISKYSHFDPGYWGLSGTAPSKPTGVDATDNTATDGTVRVTWSTVADSLVYEIFRAEIPAFLGGKIKKIGTATSTSYDDDTAVSGTRYYYWVKARNSWGVSRYSAFDTGFTGLSSFPPDAPINVTATDNTEDGKVRISWDAVDRSVVVYEIWRAADLVSNGGQPVRIGSVEESTFEDTTGTQDVVYYYWVKARDCWGASKYSVPDTGHHSAGNG